MRSQENPHQLVFSSQAELVRKVNLDMIIEKENEDVHKSESKRTFSKQAPEEQEIKSAFHDSELGK